MWTASRDLPSPARVLFVRFVGFGVLHLQRRQAGRRRGDRARARVRRVGDGAQYTDSRSAPQAGVLVRFGSHSYDSWFNPSADSTYPGNLLENATGRFGAVAY